MAVNELSFKDALSRFATGVCVVTSVGEDGAPAGMTISAFTSVSLDPPLVLFCLGRKNDVLIRGARDGRLAINILAEDQEEVSEIFASQKSDKFAGVAYTLGESGCPTINGALAVLECAVAATHDGGDHLIVVGRVELLRVLGGKPLLRYRGRYLRIT
ncbi:MAG: flavin reductase family protein [Rhodospirillales bacterium]|nr:flavin reductase family protein [Rhodospirillales bacterium]